MIEIIGKDIVVNCPKCGKLYNMEEYRKLDQVKTYTIYSPYISIRGKSAPKEALKEIAERTRGKLYEEHVDIFKMRLHDARKCSKCGTEFGFVKIVGKDKENTIFQIDLDLITQK